MAGHSPGRELMRSKRKSNGFASDPSKWCDVELKCLFSVSGSALIGWGTECAIRSMLFHSSLGLLNNRVLLKKKADSTDLILILILFRTSRNLFQTLAKFVLCTKYLFTFHSFWSFPMSSLFSQGAGCHVILVLRRGACTRQDLKSKLKCLD